MDLETARWFAEQDLHDYSLIHDYHVDSLANEFTTENLQRSLSVESYTKNATAATTTVSSSSQTSCEGPNKLLKDNSWNSDITTDHHKSPKFCFGSQFLCFESPNSVSPRAMSQQFYVNLDCAVKPEDKAASPAGKMQFQPSISRESNPGSNKRSCSLTRTPSHAQNHILAERKRREKLSQRFIALSSIVPGLKKMDKASVLVDAIKYVKQLQERVKVLEEQTKRRKVESAILVHKSQVLADDDDSSCDDNSDGCFNSELPEIEAKVSEKDVLIRIHCDRQEGILPKILHEIENLHLSIINTTILPFGNSTLHITIIAQMNSECSMGVKDVVKSLRVAFLKFI